MRRRLTICLLLVSVGCYNGPEDYDQPSLDVAVEPDADETDVADDVTEEPEFAEVAEEVADNDTTTEPDADQPDLGRPDCGAFAIGCEHNHTYSVNGLQKSSMWTAYVCDDGGAGGEIIYEHVAPADGTLEVSLDGPEGVVAMVVRNPQCSSTFCEVAVGPGGSESVPVAGGEVIRIAVEADAGVADPTYTLALGCDADAECLPYCPNDAACGDDGCGGTCGDCGDEERCVEGACLDVPDNDLIQNATMLSLPLDGPVAGDTRAAASEAYGADGDCGLDGNDVFYSFIAQASGWHAMEILGASYLGRVAVLDESTCLVPPTQGSAALSVVEGVQYWVVVDSSGIDAASSGPFELLVTQATCVPDLKTGTAGTPPWFTLGTTPGDTESTVSAPGGETCGAGGAEHVFELTAPEWAEELEIQVVDPSFEAELYVTSCIDALAGDACLGVAGANTPIVVPVSGGATYYVVVDGEVGEDGAYELRIGCPAENAVTTADPTTFSGDTAQGASDFSATLGDCPLTDANDLTVAFTAPETASYRVTATQSAKLFYLTECGQECKTSGDDALKIDLLSAGTRIWVVAEPSVPGPIDIQFCQIDCGSKVCGDDGCGGSCGDCDSGSVCDAQGQCACVPDCAGKACGDNGCSGSCGSCGDGEVCTEEFECCTPDCEGKVCGLDGCGGSCGSCGDGEICTVDNTCCEQQCEGVACDGADGCGSVCGCAEGLACTPEGTCAGTCEGSCGEYLGDDCNCDSACGGFEDCCFDFCDLCPDVDPEGCAEP